MAWRNPKINWLATDGVSSTDLNRIEDNTLHLYNMFDSYAPSKVEGGKFYYRNEVGVWVQVGADNYDGRLGEVIYNVPNWATAQAFIDAIPKVNAGPRTILLPNGATPGNAASSPLRFENFIGGALSIQGKGITPSSGSWTEVWPGITISGCLCRVFVYNIILHNLLNIQNCFSVRVNTMDINLRNAGSNEGVSGTGVWVGAVSMFEVLNCNITGCISNGAEVFGASTGRFAYITGTNTRGFNVRESLLMVASISSTFGPDLKSGGGQIFT